MKIGIIHAKRKIEYIGRTIDSIMDEFPGCEITVSCEPGAEYFENDSKIKKIVNDKVLGPYGNWLSLLAHLHEKCPTGWVLICEDDVTWLRGSGQFFCNYLREANTKVGFVSGYCSYVNRGTPGFGPAKIVPYGWCGALALAVPGPSRELILKSTLTCDLGNNKDTKIHLDNNIGRILLAGGKRLIVHTPSLVQHLGTEHSTLIPEKHKALYRTVRRTYDYATYYFDAKLRETCKDR